MRAAVLFDNLGPYHLARLRAACNVADVMAVQFGATSADYRWAGGDLNLQVRTLNSKGTSWAMPRSVFKTRLAEVLGEGKPDVVFTPGWATPGALLALEWCLENRVPAVVMSESTAWDSPRRWARECIKGVVLAQASAAFVGGGPQRDYVLQLGMPRERVFSGYNIVDNDYFERE